MDLRGSRRVADRADEVRPEPVAPDPPEWLRGAALEEWEYLVPRLARLGLLAEIDRPTLAVYCEAWASFVAATAAIRASGLALLDGRGSPRVSPFVSVQRQAANDLLRYGRALGLSPSWRAGLTGEAGTPRDELARFRERWG